MNREPGNIGRFVRGPLLAGGLVVLITEGLGALSLLRPVPVGLAWLLVGIGWMLLVRWFPNPSRWHPGIRNGFRDAPFLWSVITLLLAITFVTGFFGAPNVWDGLTYHLPRVERWVEQGHLGFWPTSVDRQLWMAPFGSYTILQFRLLSGGDRLAFLPSWLAYCGLILLTARVVRQLGGTGSQGAFGALLVATMPVAVLHASSVQTDLLTAFWVMCAAALSLVAWQEREAARDWRHAVWLSLAVALAALTKGTALLALVPWLGLYGAAVVQSAGLRGTTRPLLIGAVMLLILNGSHFSRNISVFGDPLGDTVTRGFLRVTPWTVGDGLANLGANLSLHLGGLSASWNNGWEAVLTGTMSRIGIDPSRLFPYFGGFHVPAYSLHESLAGNPLHLAIGLALILVLAVGWRRPGGDTLALWVLAGVVAYLLHGVLIRWQPSGSRLQHASLIWLAPAAALLLRGRMVQWAVVVAALLAAAPGLVANYLRPLLGTRSVLIVPRHEQYFREHRELQPALERVVAELSARDCRSAGLVTGFDSPEHLLRIAAQRRDFALMLVHLLPRSRSSLLPATPPPVGGWCGVIVMDRMADVDPITVGEGLQLAWVEGTIGLFVRR